MVDRIFNQHIFDHAGIESHGEFAESSSAAIPCPKCGGKVEYRIWESSCGGYEDYKYECLSTKCKHKWWIDGTDS